MTPEEQLASQNDMLVRLLTLVEIDRRASYRNFLPVDILRWWERYKVEHPGKVVLPYETIFVDTRGSTTMRMLKKKKLEMKL